MRAIPFRRPPSESSPPATAYLTGLVAVVGALVSLLWIAELIVNSGRGLDASDESYYLLAVRFPQAFPTTTGFDSFLAPIWWLSGRSIGRFRVAGLVTLVGALLAVGKLCSRAISVMTGWSARAGAAVIVVSLASSSFMFYVLWLPTPGYNLVVLVDGLLVAGLTSSLAMSTTTSAPESEGRRVWLPEVALGFALGVGIVVKAPAFVIVATLSGVALAITRGPKWFLSRLWRIVAGGAAGVLLFVVLAGSPVDTAHRFARGFHATGLLGSHGSESLWETTAMGDVYGPWFLKYLVGALLLRLLWRFVTRDEVRLLITTIGSVATAFAFGLRIPGGGPAAFNGNAGWWWIRLAAMTMLWCSANSSATSRRLVLGPLVCLMAVGAAAGSGNGIVHQVVLNAGVLGVGVLVHGLVVVSLRGKAQSSVTLDKGGRAVALLLPIALFFLVSSLASARALQGAVRSPYRLNGSLHSETERVDLGAVGELNVHPETARYIRELQAMASQVPPDARDCLVDLAGGTPLSALALGARPAAAGWLVGGYPGSTEYAAYLLAQAPCLSGPYVLIEAPRGPRAVARPEWLDTTGQVLLGRARYVGYQTEEQLVWLVPGS